MVAFRFASCRLHALQQQAQEQQQAIEGRQQLQQKLTT